jgi:hypothetical protein
LVARLVRDQEAAGSNPVAPTMIKYKNHGSFSASRGFLMMLTILYHKGMITAAQLKELPSLFTKEMIDYADS